MNKNTDEDKVNHRESSSIYTCVTFSTIHLSFWFIFWSNLWHPHTVPTFPESLSINLKLWILNKYVGYLHWIKEYAFIFSGAIEIVAIACDLKGDKNNMLLTNV